MIRTISGICWEGSDNHWDAQAGARADLRLAGADSLLMQSTQSQVTLSCDGELYTGECCQHSRPNSMSELATCPGFSQVYKTLMRYTAV